MGVDGFWPIVSSKGKLVTLDILADKVIAVDASIWIYQFASALRDSTTGETLKASHIVGFFRRICKLLFLRIKPVFVFDGAPIPLKFAALRKRHDETISDGMYRKAAQQLLHQNLQQLRANPSSFPVPHKPAPESEDSVDFIQVLTDSSSDGDSLSPSRRLRLSVPEEFRGFMAERRTLDCVMLPVSPEKVQRREEAKIGTADVEMTIDEESLKDLPLQEQYRGLLHARSVMLTQGRRKALHLASQMGSSSSVSGSADLHQLSADQIKAVVNLARVTDMSKSVRLQLSRDENKHEVYVPAPDLAKSGFDYSQPKRRRRKLDDLQFYDGGAESVLTSARMVKRAELLFGSTKSDEPKVELKLETLTVKDEENEGVDVANLFGAGWDDLVGKGTAAEPPIQESSISSDSSYYVSDFSHVRSPTVSERSELGDERYASTRFVGASPLSEDGLEALLDDEGDAVESVEEGEVVESVEEGEVVESVEEGEVVESVEESRAVESVKEGDAVESVEEGDAVESVEVGGTVRLDGPSEGDNKPDEEPPSLIPTHTTLHSLSPAALADLLDDAFCRLPESAQTEFASSVRERVSDDCADVYSEIQELLTAFGIPWVVSPADAEAQCAYLCSSGLVDGVVSDDSDTLIYGAPTVFRHLYMKESTVEIFRLETIGFNRDELISLALLLGCDFTEGVKGVGPVNAAEIVRHYAGLEGLREFRRWCDLRDVAERSGVGDMSGVIDPDPANPANPGNPSNPSHSLRAFKQSHANYRHQWVFPEDFPSEQVWNVFHLPLVDLETQGFSWADPHEQSVLNVLAAYTDMKQTEAETVLRATIAKYKETRIQRRITDYFSPAFQRGAVAEVVSKRLHSALQKG